MIRSQTNRVRYQNPPGRLYGTERYNLDFPEGGRDVVTNEQPLFLSSIDHLDFKHKHLGSMDESEVPFSPYDLSKPSSLSSHELPMDRIFVESSMNMEKSNNTNEGQSVIVDNSTVAPDGCLARVHRFVDSSGQVLESIQQQMQQLVLSARNETAKFALPETLYEGKSLLGLDLDGLETAIQDRAGQLLDSITTDIAMMDRPRFVTEHQGGTPDMWTLGSNEVSVKINGRIEMMQRSVLPELDTSADLNEFSFVPQRDIRQPIPSISEEFKENEYVVHLCNNYPRRRSKICTGNHHAITKSSDYSHPSATQCGGSEWMDYASPKHTFQIKPRDRQAANQHTRSIRQDSSLTDRTNTTKEAFSSSAITKQQPITGEGKPDDSYASLATKENYHLKVHGQVTTMAKVKNSVSEEEHPDDERDITDRRNVVNKVHASSGEALQKDTVLLAGMNEGVGQADIGFEDLKNVFKQHSVQYSTHDTERSNTSIDDDGFLPRQQASSLFWFPTPACFDSSCGDSSTSTEVADNTSSNWFASPFTELKHPKNSVSPNKNVEQLHNSGTPDVQKREHLEQFNIKETIRVPDAPSYHEEGRVRRLSYHNELDDEFDEGRKCGWKLNPVTTWSKSRKVLTKGDYAELPEIHRLAEF